MAPIWITIIIITPQHSKRTYKSSDSTAIEQLEASSYTNCIIKTSIYITTIFKDTATVTATTTS